MKKKSVFLILLSVACAMFFLGCGANTRTIKNLQALEEGVSSPTTIEELEDAIDKYEARVLDVMLANQQIGIWYKMLGSRYLDAQMYGLALDAFQKATEYYPQNPNLYYYVGLCAGYMSKQALDYGGTGSTAQKYNYLKLSESGYLRAVELDPNYDRALYGLGVLYIFELEQPDAAIPHLEKLLTVETRHTDGMFLLANAYYQTYEYDKAVAMYDKIIETTTSSEKKVQAEANKLIVLEAAYAQ